LRLVLVEGLDQLRVLLVSLLGALAGRAEQQRLQVLNRSCPAGWATCPSATAACRRPVNAATAAATGGSVPA
jgi:hypothetical protein